MEHTICHSYSEIDPPILDKENLNSHGDSGSQGPPGIFDMEKTNCHGDTRSQDTPAIFEMQQTNGHSDGDDPLRFDIEEVEGFCVLRSIFQLYVPNTTLKEHLDAIKQLEIREDDVIMCATAKCGTHWVWEILNMLSSGRPQICRESKVSSMLELQPVEKINRLPSPRIINTHLPPHLLPAGILKTRCKVVHVIRNRKDVTVSAFNHFGKALKAMGLDIGPMDDFKTKFLSERGHQYNFFKYILEFDEYFTKHRWQVPAITLSYEDLKHDPVEQVMLLAAFLGKNYDNGMIEDIAEACSFENMKHADRHVKEDFLGKTAPDGESAIFRKGKVGDWKNNFTVAESELYDRVTENHLGHTSIRFQYQ